MKKYLLSASLRVFSFAMILIAFVTSTQAQTLKSSTGGPNTFNLSLGQNLGGTYSPGLSFTFISNQTLTTGGATLNVNGTGIIPLVKNVNQPLIANDILAGQAVQVLYDGTNFQVLNVGSASTSTGAGTGNLHAFIATATTSGAPYPTGGYNTNVILYDAELYDTDNSYDPTTGKFQPTSPGFYHINGSGTINATGGVGSVAIYKNGIRFKDGNTTNPISTVSEVNSIVYANGVSDYFQIYIYNSTGSPQPLLIANTSYNLFSGFKINGGGTLTVTSSLGGSSSTGVSTFNGLTSTSQNFSTSSTGTSVNIVSDGNTHNFNVPLASVVGGNNITVTGSFPLYTVSGLASTATSQWVSTTGGIYYSGGDVTHYGKIIGVSAANPHIYLDNPSTATGAGTEIAINSNAGGTSKYFAVGVNNDGRNFYIFPQGGGSDAVNIDFSGNVGIGVASGSSIGAKLDVNGNARIAGLMTISSFANGGTQSLGVDNNGQLVTVAGGSSQWLNSSVLGIYYPSRVGIGSPVPSSNLEIAGSSGLTALKVTPGSSGFAGIDFTLNNTYFNISGTRSTTGALNRFTNSGSATTLDVQNTGGGNAASFTGNITVSGWGGFNGVQTPTITLSGLATGGSPQALGVNNIGQLETIAGSNNLWIDYGLGGIAYTIAGTDLKIQPGYLTYFNANSTANLGSLFSIQGTAGQYAYSQISLQNDYQRNATTPLAWDFQHNIDHSLRITENTNGIFNDRMVILPNSGNVGIGISTPVSKLDVGGSARIAGNLTITSFAGSGTQALGVNNLGQLVTIVGATPTTGTGFSVNSNVNLTLATGSTPTIINFNIRNYDKATAFNLLTDKYIVPIAGEYLFTAKALTNNIGEVDISIFVNDILVEEVRTSPDPSTGLYNTAAITALLNLAANDSVDVRIAQTTGSNQTLYSNGGTTIKFSGKRVGD